MVHAKRRLASLHDLKLLVRGTTQNIFRVFTLGRAAEGRHRQTGLVKVHINSVGSAGYVPRIVVAHRPWQRECGYSVQVRCDMEGADGVLSTKRAPTSWRRLGRSSTLLPSVAATILAVILNFVIDPIAQVVIRLI
ncbi:uncharacterized protein BJX67DRAFT_367069 [Aspergillus lucknowensis]|uniref:Uncharacterized protein n=1 Tax=Aspergillus lucknowensis TaxID=176173 RepID=A0ABR4L9K2_9EURO